MHYLPLELADFAKTPSGWSTHFERAWPVYRRWFLKEGLVNRPGFLTAHKAFEKYLPDFVPLLDKLCDEVGGGDLSSRFLTMYCPPPYMSGCSQVAWTRDEPLLVRNYDYSPRYFEGVLMKTDWMQPVMGMSDSLWGLLDGVNAAGLSASLTFGGRRLTGKGFGIPLLVRYCLETCRTTAEAVDKLRRIPAHMSYNLTLLDAQKNYATIYFLPDAPNQVTYLAVGTNHQEEITWPDYAAMTNTVGRRTILEFALMNPTETADTLVARFLEPPLFNTAYEKAFGTLYTAVYKPAQRALSLIWMDKAHTAHLHEFEAQHLLVPLRAGAARLFSL